MITVMVSDCLTIVRQSSFYHFMDIKSYGFSMVLDGIFRPYTTLHGTKAEKEKPCER